MEEAVADFLRYLSLERNASAHTVKSYREDLNQALDFFRKRLSVKRVEIGQLTPRTLRSYLAWLHEGGYAKTTMARRIAAVRSLCRFLCRQGMLSLNPASGLRGPRQDKRLPIFSAKTSSSLYWTHLRRIRQWDSAIGRSSNRSIPPAYASVS